MENNRDLSNNENKAKIENEKIEALIPEAEEPKKNKLLLFVVVGVLVLVLLVFIGLIATGTLVYNNTKPDIKEEETLEEKDENQPSTEDIKYLVSTKLYKLLNGEVTDSYSANNKYYSSFNSSLLRGELSDSTKQGITLKHTLVTEDNTERWKEHESIKKIYSYDPSGQSLDYYGSISFDEYNKTYHELFGVDAPTPEERSGVCPEFLYSEEYKEFYKITYACGAISYGNYISYISNFEINENSVDVYMNFGFIEPGFGSKTIIYGAFEEYEQDGEKLLRHTTPVDEIEEGSTGEEYIINETNMDKFTLYKFTFKNVDDNYLFDKVEKVK